MKKVRQGKQNKKSNQSQTLVQAKRAICKAQESLKKNAQKNSASVPSLQVMIDYARRGYNVKSSPRGLWPPELEAGINQLVRLYLPQLLSTMKQSREVLSLFFSSFFLHSLFLLCVGFFRGAAKCCSRDATRGWCLSISVCCPFLFSFFFFTPSLSFVCRLLPWRCSQVLLSRRNPSWLVFLLFFSLSFYRLSFRLF